MNTRKKKPRIQTNKKNTLGMKGPLSRDSTDNNKMIKMIRDYFK